jgi:glutathione synthase/RimK-type ligase-like ATP-grasp enzyme
MILLVSTPGDDHTAAVARLLSQAGLEAKVLDLSSFPQAMRLVLHFDGTRNRDFTILEADGQALALSCVTAVWWRRPQPFVVHPEISRPDHRGFILKESYTAFAGLWQSLDVLWINHPMYDQAAHHKPYQLRVAQNVGLEIPETLVTNDPEEARRFIAHTQHKGTVYKAFLCSDKVWRETRIVRAAEHELLHNVRYAPVIFQEYVDAVYDLRVTVVGDRVFAAAIRSQSTSYPVDYRMDLRNAAIEPVELPTSIERKLVRLTKALGLVYGGIDMRLTPDHRYIFFEINPAGQWLFIEHRTGQPIARAIASLLANRDLGLATYHFGP